MSPALLDVGPYPNAPRPPLGTAGNPESGTVVDAQHMADFVIGPWDVDESLIDPYLDSFYVLSSPKGLQSLGPEGVAAAAGRHGFVNGFASARQVPDKTAMVNAVLRFPDPAAAAAASTDMGDAAVKQPVKGVTPTGPRQVGAGSTGQENRDSGHVVVATDAAQRRRRCDRVAECVESGSHHLRREGPGRATAVQ